MPPLMEKVVLQPLIAAGDRVTAASEQSLVERYPRHERRSYARIQDATEVPKLIETQLESFKWFQEVGLT